MWSKSYKVINHFIDENQKNEIIKYIDSLQHENFVENHHIKKVTENINGQTYMFDISKNEITEKVTNYQSGNNICHKKLDTIFYTLIDMITKEINIPKKNIFLQIIDMKQGGTIIPHYDFTLEGYINFKCNVSVLSEDYVFTVGKDDLEIMERDLYCFEASIFKHSTKKKFNSRRIVLSFGFMLPYECLGRDHDDVYVRLSNRIMKYFK